WNALALMDTFKAGEVHWQIRRDGEIEFSVRSKDGGSHWEIFLSPPIVTRERFGQWLHLAAVYNASRREVSLYVNGESVLLKKNVQPVELSLGAIELGNWSPVAKTESADYRARAFHGQMD